MAQALRTKVEKSGRTVYYTYIPTPGKHPAGETVEPMLMILGVLGFLALILSGLLVVNTMQALLTQQVRQMGIMKAVGARNGQIMGIYCGMVIAFGVLALAVAVPLGALGAQGLTQFMANLLNFDIERPRRSRRRCWRLEVAIGLAVPLLAALYPIITAARITPREAMSDYGLAARPLRPASEEPPGRLASPPVRPADAALAAQHLPAQGSAGADAGDLDPGRRASSSVCSACATRCCTTLDNMFQYVDYDAIARLPEAAPDRPDRGEALKVPGVAAAEGWRFDNARRMRPDDTESDPVFRCAASRPTAP